VLLDRILRGAALCALAVAAPSFAGTLTPVAPFTGQNNGLDPLSTGLLGINNAG
jgi:hypothetical protein